MLKWLLDLITKRDRDLGLYFAAALAVIFTAIMALQAGVTADGLSPFVWLIGRVVIAAAVLIFAFHLLRKSPLVGLVANILVVVCTLYFLAGVAQVMSSNMLNPPLAKAACFFNPFQAACPLSASYSTAAVEQAHVEDVTEDPTAVPIIAQMTRVEDGETISEVLVLEKAAFVPPAENRVFVQFAGAISRDDVVTAARALTNAGWEVPDAEKGGERTANAANLNEIRYFNADDAQAALELARSFAESATWVAAGDLKVRDLSGAGFSPQAAHQFEIWTSLR
jgi:hypothetical protein